MFSTWLLAHSSATSLLLTPSGWALSRLIGQTHASVMAVANFCPGPTCALSPSSPTGRCSPGLLRFDRQGSSMADAGQRVLHRRLPGSCPGPSVCLSNQSLSPEGCAVCLYSSLSTVAAHPPLLPLYCRRSYSPTIKPGPASPDCAPPVRPAPGCSEGVPLASVSMSPGTDQYVPPFSSSGYSFNCMA